MISRKRELEKTVRTAFENFAADNGDLTGVNVYISRQKRDNDDPYVQVICSAQRSLDDIDTYGSRMMVEGAIICTAPATDDPTTIEDLEILAENFVEIEESQMLSIWLNGETTAIEITGWQPEDNEDGYDADTKRYIARHQFSAYVRDLNPYA